MRRERTAADGIGYKANHVEPEAVAGLWGVILAGTDSNRRWSPSGEGQPGFRWGVSDLIKQLPHVHPNLGSLRRAGADWKRDDVDRVSAYLGALG